MIKKILTYSFLILMLGCGNLQKVGRIYPIQMSNTLGYYGFTVERPIYHEWYLYPAHQHMRNANLYRETDSKTHTVYFNVNVDSITDTNFDSYVDKVMRRRIVNDSIRYMLIKSDLSKIDSVTYKFENKILDKRPLGYIKSGELIIKSIGYIEKHKYLKNISIHRTYSERGTVKDFNNSYFSESKQLFKSINQIKQK